LIEKLLAVSKQFTNLIDTSLYQDRMQIRLTLALWQLRIYLFIIERCTVGKHVTQWAKNLSHWVTKFSSLGDIVTQL